MWRRFILAGSILFLALALPNDLANIRFSLADTDHRLALGLSLKTLMAVLAILGLWLDRTFGYAFLLGITLQSSLICVGSLLGGDFWLPAIELLFRVNCLAFLIVNARRLVGRR